MLDLLPLTPAWMVVPVLNCNSACANKGVKPVVDLIIRLQCGRIASIVGKGFSIEEATLRFGSCQYIQQRGAAQLFSPGENCSSSKMWARIFFHNS